MHTHQEAVHEIAKKVKIYNIEEQKLRKVENMLRASVIRKVGYDNLLMRKLTDEEREEGKLGRLDTKKVSDYFTKYVVKREDEKFCLYEQPLLSAYDQLVEKTDGLLSNKMEDGVAGIRYYIKFLDEWDWVKEQKGVAEKLLARLITQTGDVRRYYTPACLWKRMGVGLVENVSNGKLCTQGRPGDKATSKDWEKHAYNPRRRSVLWNLGVSLIKQGIRTDKETGEKYAISMWGAIYLYKLKEITERFEAKGGQILPADSIPVEHRQGEHAKPKKGSLYGVKYMSQKHRHRRAQRYMEKKFLELWWTIATGNPLHDEALPSNLVWRDSGNFLTCEIVDGKLEIKLGDV